MVVMVTFSDWKTVTTALKYNPIKHKSSGEIFLVPGKSDFVSGAAPEMLLQGMTD